jgi:uncharacterized cupredoxin-like copper-binding protein
MPKALEFTMASLVALIAGFFGFIFLFSDPTGGVSERAFWYGVHFFIPGLLIGMLFPRAWYMAGIVAWPSVGIAVGTLVFRVVGLVVPMPNYPDVQVVVHDGSIDVKPEILQLTESQDYFSLNLWNADSSAHEIVLIPSDPGEDLEALASDLAKAPSVEAFYRERTIFQMPKLRPGEAHEATVQMVGERMAVLCSMPGHAQRGEIGEIREEEP